MGNDIGFEASTPSLPGAGGAVASLGETFTPDLSTGGGSFTVGFDLPNGPNDIGPRLQLRYDTGQGNGPFGLGFTLPLPRLVRSTAKRFPSYDDGDALVLEGAGELVRTGPGTFRPEVDAGAWRAQADGAGFRCHDRAGNAYLMGTTPAARLAQGGRVFAWHLERIEDALGNAVAFAWLRDGEHLYLDTVTYGGYEVAFHYTARPDVLRFGRPGFLVTTALRCDEIALRRPGSPQPLLRRWSLGYRQHEANGSSLLTEVTLSGNNEAGATATAPPLRLTYTATARPTLDRFRTADPGAAPGPLGGGRRRVELIDWDGDGLPDLLEIEPSGRARLWPNLGELTWGRPRPAGDLPSLGGALAAVALADLDGDGAADLVLTDRPPGGYVPRDPAGTFGRPVTWRQSPHVAPASSRVRFTDLDGDGIPDLLASAPGALSLYYRADPDGWQPRPQVVERGHGPVLDLSDPHVFVADMTGDGSDDLVRVDGAGVTYWPYLGNGRWADPVTMADPPGLGPAVRADRLLLADVDGDGCADLVQLDGDRVRWWLNQGGNRFSAAREVRAVPTERMTDVRVADMRGNGVPGLLWSLSGDLSRQAAYLLLDLTGGSKPYLLAGIDNGVGLTTRLDYSTSAREAARDAAAGRPWTSRLPVALPVVARLETTDAATGTVATETFSYSEGRWDGVLREFAGFGVVEQELLGDAVAPTLRTRYEFATGVDPVTGVEPATRTGRRRLRAVRGQLLRQERYGRDGSALEHRAYDIVEHSLRVDEDGPAMVPRLVRTVHTTYERGAAPASVLTTTNLSWDAAGNITESVQTSEAPADPGATKTLRTLTRFATDPTGRFVNKPWRVTQLDGTGARVADSVTEFDGQPEGSVGPRGLVTARSALVLTDALAGEAYGTSLPDFASLGYHRRAGEDGWWTSQGRYTRIEDSAGLSGRVTGPRGATTSFTFDATRTHPVAITDPMGNSVQVQHDDRVNRVRQLTDASGAVFRARFDPLGRLTALIEPGDSDQLPTRVHEYGLGAFPVTTVMRQRAESGAAVTIDTRERWDGAGRLLERRVVDDLGEIVTVAQVYGARGMLARLHLPARATSPGYAVPAATTAHTAYAYDALGRLVRQVNADGSVRTVSYGALLVEEADEEDNHVGGDHEDTTTLKRIDPTGRVRTVEQHLDGRMLASHYHYDVKGDLVRHVDALGREVRIWHDLLGRTIAVRRPEQLTRSVFDAAGNAVQARSATRVLAVREFDAANRPVAVRHGSATAPPVARFTYHDGGAPPPPDAGAHTAGGRCVRIEDEAGVTVFDYDARGRVARKRSTPTGATDTYELDVSYRADGQIASIEYPGTPTRLKVAYAYDRLGRVASVPGFVDTVAYDLTGRRTRLGYVNGTEQTYGYDDRTTRLSSMELNGPAGALRTLTLRHDLVGNVVGIDSPQARLTASYTYDDLYRLVSASTGAGESWTYRYDDTGALTFKSDVGDYRYGEDSAPATCPTSAGTATFTYGELGEMDGTPWGRQTFDLAGRLTRIVDGTTVSEFTYDYAGLRVGVSSGGRERVSPDPLYAIEDGQLVLHVYDGVGVAARRLPSGATLFLHADHLGGLAGATDMTGTLVESLRYDPYGVVLERTGTGRPLPNGFTGGEPDEVSGLLYLGARWYAPRFGMFVSPDPIVQDIYDPFSWAAYAYCRDNPVTLTDPTGRGFWAIFLAALAIVALVVVTVLAVVLDIISFGALTAPLAIGIIALGMVVGGIVGGLAAYQKGGNTAAIIEGVLVGAAVGGWAAFATVAGGGVGGAAAGAVHATGFWGAVAAGAVNGAITGAAMGFAAGYAGGLGTLDEIVTKMWQGALVGLVTGALIGGLSYAIKPPTTTAWEDMGKALRPEPAMPPPAGAPPPGGGFQPPVSVSDPGTALLQTGQGIAGKVIGAGASNIARSVLTSSVAPLVNAFVVDTAVGAWELGYVPALLDRIGVIKFGGTF
jgi:RHS repeat-associated protein